MHPYEGKKWKSFCFRFYVTWIAVLLQTCLQTYLPWLILDRNESCPPHTGVPPLRPPSIPYRRVCIYRCVGTLNKKKSKRKPKVSKLFVKTKPELHIILFRTKNSTLNHRKVSITVSILVFWSIYRNFY